MPALFTERLDLIPLDAALLAASLEGRRAEVERRLNAKLPEEWPLHPPAFRRRLEQLSAEPELLPWLLRAMVLRSSREVVGQIGCHSAPGPAYLDAYSPGAVELGYSVSLEFRRRGFAREGVRALMRWATEEHGVPAVVLSIRPDNLPSQAVSRALGFARIGSHMDEEDGEEDVLEWKPPFRE